MPTCSFYVRWSVGAFLPQRSYRPPPSVVAGLYSVSGTFPHTGRPRRGCADFATHSSWRGGSSESSFLIGFPISPLCQVLDVSFPRHGRLCRLLFWTFALSIFSSCSFVVLSSWSISSIIFRVLAQGSPDGAFRICAFLSVLSIAFSFGSRHRWLFLSLLFLDSKLFVSIAP